MTKSKHFRAAIPDCRRARRERLQHLQERQRPKTPVLGERIAVLTTESDVAGRSRDRGSADDASRRRSRTPTGRSRAAMPSKSMGQLALGTALASAFTVQAGRGSSLTARLASAPVVANGRVYTIDTLGAVRAFDARPARTTGRARRPTTSGNEAVALRRRHRLRQRPDLRDQRPRLCRRRSTSATAASSGRSAPADRCAARRPSPTARSM